MRAIKFRAWTGRHMEDADPYFFEANDIESFSALPDGWILMQYTGLKDKNGREIYEGDVVDVSMIEYPGSLQQKIVSKERFSVEWHDFNCRFVLQEKGEDGKGYGFNSQSNEIEVIGNIYENPELIK